MNEIKLDLCKQCGGQARFNIGWNHYIECTNIECGMRTPGRYSKAECVAIWNDRYDPNPWRKYPEEKPPIEADEFTEYIIKLVYQTKTMYVATRYLTKSFLLEGFSNVGLKAIYWKEIE